MTSIKGGVTLFKKNETREAYSSSPSQVCFHRSYFRFTIFSLYKLIMVVTFYTFCGYRGTFQRFERDFNPSKYGGAA